MISDELILAATHGESSAQEEVLAYYNVYINSLAMKHEILENGRKVTYLDSDIKTQIQVKLMESMQKFR